MKSIHVMSCVLGVAGTAAASVFYGKTSGSAGSMMQSITWYSDEACTSTAGVVAPTASGASEHSYVILGAAKWTDTSSFPDVTTYLGTDGATVGSSVSTAFNFNMNCDLTLTFPHVTVFSGVFMANADCINPVAFRGDYTFVKTSQPIEFRASNVGVAHWRGAELAGTCRSAADVSIALTTTGANQDVKKGVTGIFRLTGDFSGFKGCFDVPTPTYTPYAKGGLATLLELKSDTAFGDTSAPRTDAITLHDKVHFRVTTNVVQSAARGMTLTLGASGNAYLVADAAEDWTLSAPLYGAAGTLVKEGAGSVTLNGPTQIGAIAVTNGTLVLGYGFTFAAGCTVTVKAGARLVSSFPSGLNVVLEDGASFALSPIPYDPATDATTPAALTTGQTWEGRLGVTLSQPIPLPFATEKRLLVMTIPQSVKTVTADDFQPSTRDEGLPVKRFEVVTDGAGLQSVYLVARPVLYSTDANKTETNMGVLTNTTLWTDGRPAHGNADYVINNGAYLTTSAADAEELTFPGDSLEISGGSRLHLRTHDTTFSNLVIETGSRLTARGCGAGVTPHRVHGRLRVVKGSSSSQVDLPGWCSQTSWAGFDLCAELVGTTRIQFGGSPGTDFIVSSTNITYQGTFGLGVGGNKDIAICFAHPEALGGALPTFTYDALSMFSSYNGIKPMTSMTYAVPNRGLYLFEPENFICTPEGVDFTFLNQIRSRKGFRKTGPGTLALGGDYVFGSGGTTAPNGTNNRLSIEAGYLRAVTTNSYEKLLLSFADGAGIAVNAHPADADVAAYGLCSSTAGNISAAGKIAVRLNGADAEIAAGHTVSAVVCTVAAGTPDLTHVLKGVKPGAPYSGRVTHETLPDGRVRYTMTFEQRGFVILIK